MATKIPVEINLHQQSAYLTLKYDDQSFNLAAEYLRGYFHSAEVIGHRQGEGKLNAGKENGGIQQTRTHVKYAKQIM